MPFPTQRPRFCIFEYVYFARPDSIIDGHGVYQVRKSIGSELAKESPVEADMVVPVPDSGVPAAIGYAREAGIPFELGIVRNHYVGRTFIQPTQSVRELGVRLKHSANRSVVKDKKIVLIDDSIVRGTTSVKIVQMMRDAGAREVHFRISSPPITHPDYYGIDTPSREKLLAATHSLEEMRRYIGCDSLAFLSVAGIYRAMGEEGRWFVLAGIALGNERLGSPYFLVLPFAAAFNFACEGGSATRLSRQPLPSHSRMQ
jgi:amidophosphoribosyltransferase